MFFIMIFDLTRNDDHGKIRYVGYVNFTTIEHFLLRRESCSYNKAFIFLTMHVYWCLQGLRMKTLITIYGFCRLKVAMCWMSYIKVVSAEFHHSQLHLKRKCILTFLEP